MSDNATISPICQRLLEEHRDTLNAQFLARRTQGVPIEADVWLQHLQYRILPLVDAVHPLFPERSGRFLLELYDVSLDLFTVGHFNENEGVLPQALDRLWKQTLLLMARTTARAPRQVAGSLSNAVLSIAQSKRQSVSNWLDRLEAIHEHIESPEQLLKAGQVAAWGVGLAEYRTGALDVAKELPGTLVRILLELPDSASDAEIQRQLDEWTSNPWSFNLHGRPSNLQIVQVCGAFRGFGGLFLRPPRVAVKDRQLFVTDGLDTWQLQADRFGHSFHRSDVAFEELSAKPQVKSPKIDPSGHLQWGSDIAIFAELGQASSQACDGQTLAITLGNSFHVYLVARSSEVVAHHAGSVV